jgi:hypothetical protein
MKIKYGTTRTVLLVGKYAIKLPLAIPLLWRHFLLGLIGNMTERDTWKWNTGKSYHPRSEYLCPVIWASWGGWLLIMKRAKPLPDTFELENYIPLMEKLQIDGDDNISNYGMLDGRLVKTDYESR